MSQKCVPWNLRHFFPWIYKYLLPAMWYQFIFHKLNKKPFSLSNLFSYIGLKPFRTIVNLPVILNCEWLTKLPPWPLAIGHWSMGSIFRLFCWIRVHFHPPIDMPTLRKKIKMRFKIRKKIKKIKIFFRKNYY